MTSPFGRKTLNDFGFSPLLEALPITCLDVGARGGFTKDLLPLAHAVTAIGFEPDSAECARLNSQDDRGPWRQLRFIPEALGKTNGTRHLNIYSKRGCSSFLEADSALAKRFGRESYYVLDDKLEVPTMTVDQAATEYGFTDAAYLKLDVQGAELEILQGCQKLLQESLVALRVEVSFIPIYKDQPLFADIDRALQHYEFAPMRFLEVHPWRRYSRAKLPKLDNGPFPYSQGQLIHGDILYMRSPESMPDDDPVAVERLVRAGLIALAYGLVDHARAFLDRPSVKSLLDSRFGIEPLAATSAVSKHLARQSTPPLSIKFRSELRKLLRIFS